MYGYLEQAKLLSEEQKIFRQRIRGTKDQMFIDKHLLKNCNKRYNNLSMALIDYKKTCDFVMHSWINECTELFGILDNVRSILEKSMGQ